MPRASLTVLAATLFVLTAAPAAAAPDDGSEYSCLVQGPHESQFWHDIGMVECTLGSQVWELAWYYPPALYQAWCLVTHHCP